MNTESRNIIIFVIAIIVITGGIAFISSRKEAAVVGPDLTGFAQCLKDEGAVFYGAFWCPHCQATKRLFGKAQSELPYVECSTPDGRDQKPLCTEKEIEGYPTWIFADGSRLKGELTLAQLASKTGCELPSETTGADGSDPTATTSTSTVDTTSSAR